MSDIIYNVLLLFSIEKKLRQRFVQSSRPTMLYTLKDFILHVYFILQFSKILAFSQDFNFVTFLLPCPTFICSLQH